MDELQTQKELLTVADPWDHNRRRAAIDHVVGMVSRNLAVNTDDGFWPAAVVRELRRTIEQIIVAEGVGMGDDDYIFDIDGYERWLFTKQLDRLNAKGCDALELTELSGLYAKLSAIMIRAVERHCDQAVEFEALALPPAVPPKAKGEAVTRERGG